LQLLWHFRSQLFFISLLNAIESIVSLGKPIFIYLLLDYIQKRSREPTSLLYGYTLAVLVGLSFCLHSFVSIVSERISRKIVLGTKSIFLYELFAKVLRIKAPDDDDTQNSAASLDDIDPAKIQTVLTDDLWFVSDVFEQICVLWVDL